jgi:hypothetical protein
MAQVLRATEGAVGSFPAWVGLSYFCIAKISVYKLFFLD